MKVVSIGGGSGQSVLLKALKKYTEDITAIVCVTDCGRNSGMLRKEIGILPPGDIRNCLVALSNSEELMKELFGYRFQNESLEGNSIGNLFLAALTKITGSFEEAIKETSKILKLKGKVLPSTLKDIHICAELENGDIVEGEINIINRGIKNKENSIKRVFLKPDAFALSDCIEEIKNADAIIIGPGALYTSIITNLLVKGVSEAINQSKGKKIYICNITQMPDQTIGFKASDHVKEVIKYLGGKLDFVILNTGVPESGMIEEYEKQGSALIENDIEEIKKIGVGVLEADILSRDIRADMWDRLDYLRHDVDKIMEAIKSIMGD
ncbi:MAG: YvcK family protein [Candidatus Aenigmarchaeota archaeon]|nr:YvcK family protein [Candidatus Aenigmarchaeota archaeon]